MNKYRRKCPACGKPEFFVTPYLLTKVGEELFGVKFVGKRARTAKRVEGHDHSIGVSITSRRGKKT